MSPIARRVKIPTTAGTRQPTGEGDNGETCDLDGTTDDTAAVLLAAAPPPATAKTLTDELTSLTDETACVSTGQSWADEVAATCTDPQGTTTDPYAGTESECEVTGHSWDAGIERLHGLERADGDPRRRRRSRVPHGLTGRTWDAAAAASCTSAAATTWALPRWRSAKGQHWQHVAAECAGAMGRLSARKEKDCSILTPAILGPV